MDCLFCKIINRDVPSYTIYENENVLAFLDITPKSTGHTLVIPKKHCKNIVDSDFDFDFFLEVKKVALLLQEKLLFDGFNIYVNNEEIAGQEIMHMHFHIVPVYKLEKFDKNNLDKVMNLLNG